MKPEYFIWLQRAPKEATQQKEKRKRKERLQNESVCLKKVLHFTWLQPSHFSYMGFFAAPVQLYNHVPGMEASKGHSNQPQLAVVAQGPPMWELFILTGQVIKNSWHIQLQHTQSTSGYSKPIQVWVTFRTWLSLCANLVSLWSTHSEMFDFFSAHYSLRPRWDLVASKVCMDIV